MGIVGDAFERSVKTAVAGKGASLAGKAAAEEAADQAALSLAQDVARFPQRGAIAELSSEAMEVLEGRRNSFQASVTAQKSFFNKLATFATRDRAGLLGEYLNRLDSAAKQGGGAMGDLVGRLAGTADQANRAAAAAPATHEYLAASLIAMKHLASAEPEAAVRSAVETVAKRPLGGMEPERVAEGLKANLTVIQQVARADSLPTSALMAKVAGDALDRGTPEAMTLGQHAIQALAAGQNPTAAVIEEGMRLASAQAQGAAKGAWLDGALSTLRVLGTERDAESVSAKLIDETLAIGRKAPGSDQAIQGMSVALMALGTLTSEAPSQAGSKALQQLLDLGMARSSDKALATDAQLGWMAASRRAIATVGAASPEASFKLASRLAAPEAAGREAVYSSLDAIKGVLGSTSGDPARDSAQHLSVVMKTYLDQSGKWDTKFSYSRAYLQTMDQLAQGHADPVMQAFRRMSGPALAGSPSSSLAAYEGIEASLRATESLFSATEAPVATAFGRLATIMDGYVNKNATELDTRIVQMNAWAGVMGRLKAGTNLPGGAEIDRLLAFSQATAKAQPTGVGTFESLRAAFSGLSELSTGASPAKAREKLADTVLGWLPKNANQTLDTKSIWMNARLGAIQALSPESEQALVTRAQQAFAQAPTGVETYETLQTTLNAVRSLDQGQTPEQILQTQAKDILGFVDSSKEKWETKASWMKAWMGTSREVAALSQDPGVHALLPLMDQTLGVASQGKAPSRQAFQQLYTTYLGLREFQPELGSSAALRASGAVLNRGREFARTNTSGIDNRAYWLQAYLGTAGQLARTGTGGRATLLTELADKRLAAIAPHAGTQEAFDQLSNSLQFATDLVANGARFEPGAALPSLSQLETEHFQRKLFSTNAAAVMPFDADALLGVFKASRLDAASKAKIHLGNVTQEAQTKAGFAVAVLSHEGKQELAAAPEAFQLEAPLNRGLTGVPWAGKDDLANLHQGLRFGAEAPLVAPLDPQRHLKRVLMHPDDRAAFLPKYEAAVKAGEAPATLNGKPYADFFQASDDFFNDLSKSQLRRVIPGFADRSFGEQITVTALATKVANGFPESVPQAARLRVAAAMIHFEPTADAGALKDPVAELKTFYHGTRVAKQVVESGHFKVGPRVVYGQGIYYGGPTVGSDYALDGDLTKPGQIVSGLVDPGKVTHKDFSGDTRHVLRRFQNYPEVGDYYLTKDPKRFRIQAVTSYDPGTVDPSAVPELLKAQDTALDWAKKTLAKVPAAQADGAVLGALKSSDAQIQAGARKFLADRQVKLDLPSELSDHPFYASLDQGGIGGGHLPKQVLVDEEANRWLLKTVPEKESFRALGDSVGSEVLDALGIRTPQVKAVTQHAGDKVVPGTLQEMWPHTGKAVPTDPTQLTAGQVDDLLEGQVGRWLISDHDGKAANFLLMADNHLASIDLGQMFRFFPQDQLSRTYKPNADAPIFNDLWAAYVKGQVSVDFQRGLDVVARVEAMPDDRYLAMLRPYVEARYQQAGAAGSLKTADDFLAAALERKHHLRQDFTAFYDSLAKERGFSGLAEAMGQTKTSASPA